MSSTTVVTDVAPLLAARIAQEGYGPGAWHGADLKAALAATSPQAAFRRPGKGRHNVAEIALHHAWCVRSVIGRLTGDAPEPFVLEGEDWFEVSERGPLGWTEITALVEDLQGRLTAVMADIGAGGITSPLSAREQFDIVLGITCHAIYHAGQVQLVNVLGAA